MIYLVLELYWSLVSKGGSVSEVQQEVKSRLEKRRVRGRGASIRGWLPGPAGSQVLCSITWEATWLASVLC